MDIHMWKGRYDIKKDVEHLEFKIVRKYKLTENGSKLIKIFLFQRVAL